MDLRQALKQLEQRSGKPVAEGKRRAGAADRDLPLGPRRRALRRCADGIRAHRDLSAALSLLRHAEQLCRGGNRAGALWGAHAAGAKPGLGAARGRTRPAADRCGAAGAEPAASQRHRGGAAGVSRVPRRVRGARFATTACGFISRRPRCIPTRSARVSTRSITSAPTTSCPKRSASRRSRISRCSPARATANATVAASSWPLGATRPSTSRSC